MDGTQYYVVTDASGRQQTFHRVGRWHVSMRGGVGSLGRTDKARGVLLWGRA